MKKDITLTIDGKMHKLMEYNEPCWKCSLKDFCKNRISIDCPALALDGGYFVELKVEK